MTKRFGFTLAEVLITLGIIGVVAAMSIPTLIANTNSAKFKSQFKKTIATLNQAALMSQAQYDFDFAGATADSDLKNLDPKANSSVAAMLAGTLSGVTITDQSPYKAAKATEPTEPTGMTIESKGYAKLADGSLLVFNMKKGAANVDSSGNVTRASGAGSNAAFACTVEPGTAPDKYIKALATAGCAGWIDVNGPTSPNAESVCDDASITGLYAGEGTASKSKVCTVKGDAAHTHDVYPVVYHDGIVEPATYAGRAILSAAK